MKTDYSTLSKPQIKEKIAILTLDLMQSFYKGKKERKKKVRKEIARLKTELSRRRKNEHTKELD